MYKIIDLIDLSCSESNFQFLQHQFSTIEQCVEHAQTHDLQQIIIYKYQAIPQDILLKNLPNYIEFISQFKQFAQQFDIDYCCSIILQGDIITNPGYHQFRVLVKSNSVDVIYIDKNWYNVFKTDKLVTDESFGQCVKNYGWLFVCKDCDYQTKNEIAQKEKYTITSWTPRTSISILHQQSRENNIDFKHNKSQLFKLLNQLKRR